MIAAMIELTRWLRRAGVSPGDFRVEIVFRTEHARLQAASLLKDDAQLAHVYLRHMQEFTRGEAAGIPYRMRLEPPVDVPRRGWAAKPLRGELMGHD